MNKTKKPPTESLGEQPVRLGFYDVPIEYVRRAFAVRRFIDSGELLQLAVSIKTHGLLSPIVVRPAGEVDGHPLFELVCGDRRWHAAKSIGMDRITCSVRMLTDLEAIELQLAENSQRVDLTPGEYAHAFQRLKSAGGAG